MWRFLHMDNLAHVRCRLYYLGCSHTCNTLSRGIPRAQLCRITPTSAKATEPRPVLAAIAGGFKEQEVIGVHGNGCSTVLNM